MVLRAYVWSEFPRKKDFPGCRRAPAVVEAMADVCCGKTRKREFFWSGKKKRWWLKNVSESVSKDLPGKFAGEALERQINTAKLQTCDICARI